LSGRSLERWAGGIEPLSHLLVFSYGEALALLDQLGAALG
jgi:hypothetical protein